MMSALRRLSTTIFSRVDQAVAQIENHDAVVEASVRDAKRAAARAKVRLARVHADGERLRNRIANLEKSAASWAERARSVAAKDEDTALECLRRSKACQQQLEELRGALKRHQAVESRLASDIHEAESRLGNITQQRNLMRTRQSAAEALKFTSALDRAPASDIEDIFERWEIQVTETELALGNDDPVDTLDRQFLADEERAELRAELSAMLTDNEE